MLFTIHVKKKKGGGGSSTPQNVKITKRWDLLLVKPNIRSSWAAVLACLSIYEMARTEAKLSHLELYTRITYACSLNLT